MNKPSENELIALIGPEAFQVWLRLSEIVEGLYDVRAAWNSGGKKWVYEQKFSVGSKTLAGLYAKQNDSGFMIIFGGAEREKVELIRQNLSPETLSVYDSADTYRDGKWVMLPLKNELVEDYIKLLGVKRKPRS